ncbi:hypothetical protein TNCV_4066171 [Trichonephila clavipes]|uniref:Uncharacterized protein n=1 Tax=Trichonephila clavipes TaxID=2585209 RepID=A0A8X6W8L6_TRICX|nr:hypothetical protein TNCV_4066171 [Trichonephila clavipes]
MTRPVAKIPRVPEQCDFNIHSPTHSSMGQMKLRVTTKKDPFPNLNLAFVTVSFDNIRLEDWYKYLRPQTNLTRFFNDHNLYRSKLLYRLHYPDVISSASHRSA